MSGDVAPWDGPTVESGIEKMFMQGRSRAVRLPLAFRLPANSVRRGEGGLLLEPMVTDLDTWFRKLDRFAEAPFMEDGRRQPVVPDAEDFFD